GRENVFLNGALLGFNRKEMKLMYDGIVSFAELHRFMDQKLKNYSSGMQVRLAFSIAIRAKSDILVMDEVLAVGDAAFQKKCLSTFRELKKQGRTIILVTHDMGNVERFCDRVLVLDKGKQIIITNPAEASSIYARLNIDERVLSQKEIDDHTTRVRTGSGEVKVTDSNFYNGTKQTTVFNSGDQFSLKINLQRKKGYENTPIVCGLAIYNEDGVVVTGPNSYHSGLKPTLNDITITIPKLPLAPGEYHVTISVYDKENTNIYDLLEKWVSFSVISDHVMSGLVAIECEWSTT
ncbi:MAG TPA: Wzt carbohydrate-binding domain-containing protein, partial [Candidatus Saccharimonadales bacterium]